MKKLICKIFGHRWYTEVDVYYTKTYTVFYEHVCTRCSKEIRN